MHNRRSLPGRTARSPSFFFYVNVIQRFEHWLTTAVCIEFTTINEANMERQYFPIKKLVNGVLEGSGYNAGGVPCVYSLVAL